MNSIWGTDSADILLVSKENTKIILALRVIDMYSNHICYVPLMRKLKSTAKDILKSNKKPNKEFVNLKNEKQDNCYKGNNFEMYNTNMIKNL